MSTWVARVADGPILDDVIAGNEPPDRVFVVGDPWQAIRLAPMPEGLRRPPHWVIVGGDGIGEDPEDEQWPGEVTYRLYSVEPANLEHIDLIALYSYDATAYGD